MPDVLRLLADGNAALFARLGACGTGVWSLVTLWRQRDAQMIARQAEEIGRLSDENISFRAVASNDARTTDQVRSALANLRDKYTPIQLQNSVMRANRKRCALILGEILESIPSDETHIREMVREMTDIFQADIVLPEADC